MREGKHKKVIRDSNIQRSGMLANVLWLIESREAHASHGWDISEA